jgi:hypothetical protein
MPLHFVPGSRESGASPFQPPPALAEPPDSVLLYGDINEIQGAGAEKTMPAGRSWRPERGIRADDADDLHYLTPWIM